MAQRSHGPTNEQVERIVGNLLRFGVFAAALIVLIGGVLYLIRFGAAAQNYEIFRGEPAELRSVSRIVRDVVSLDSRSVIQFGLLLLIATPVARVAFSIVAFALQRDLTYVVVTLIVFALLLYSLTGGGL